MFLKKKRQQATLRSLPPSLLFQVCAYIVRRRLINIKLKYLFTRQLFIFSCSVITIELKNVPIVSADEPIPSGSFIEM